MARNPLPTTDVVIIVHYCIHCCRFGALCNSLVLILFGLFVQIGTTFANEEGLTTDTARKGVMEGGRNGEVVLPSVPVVCVVDNCLVLVSVSGG